MKHNNVVKIAYMILAVIFSLTLLTAMVLIPVYITPGYYWWSGLLFLLVLISSNGAATRMDEWDI